MSVDRAEMDRRWFAYFYDGDDFQGALINKFGVRDPAHLQRVEYRAATVRALEMHEGRFTIAQTFDLEHYLAIHRALLGDVYSWAGTVRDVDLVKGNYSFADVDEISKVFDRAHAIAVETPWRHLGRDAAMGKLAEVYSLVNHAHPCREGNGRAARMFMRDVAAHAGYEFHEARLGRDELIAAAVAGGRGDLRPATAMFRAHTILGPSQAQLIAAAPAVAPTTTLRERLDRLYVSHGRAPAQGGSATLADRLASLTSFVTPTAATTAMPHAAPRPHRYLAP